VLLLLIQIVVFPVFAGVTVNSSNLKEISTPHFDIIYGEESQITASVIVENCEKQYQDLVAFFGKDPDFRLPVVITSDYLVLNAYYTPSPYNRIVLYDTITPVGSLSNFEETIVSVFRHELTHAFTYNLRSPFIQSLSDIVGDIVSTGPFLYYPNSFVEGIAVTTESLDGVNGRLHDSSVLQILKQGKIEGKFPSWFGASGIRDTNPVGDETYIMGGAFLDYVRTTYGQETLANLFIKGGNFNWFKSTASLFKDVTGSKISTIWKDFVSSINVPENVIKPNILLSNKKSGYYSNIAYKDGYYFVYDWSRDSLLRFSADLSSYEPIIEALSYDMDIDLGNNGKILMTKVFENQSSLDLYSLENDTYTRKTITISEEYGDLKDGAFVYLNKEYLLLYSNIGQETFFSIYDIETQEVVRTIPLGYGVTASCLTNLNNNSVAFIYSYKGKDNIALINCDKMEVSLLENENNLRIRSLSCGTDDNGKNVLSFSYGPEDENSPDMMRYGEVTNLLESPIIRLSQEDFSGGVYYPLRHGQLVLYVGVFYEDDKLCTTSINDLSFNEKSGSWTLVENKETQDYNLELLNNQVKYNPLSHMTEGICVPLFILNDSIGDVGVGGTFITQDPTENHLISVSGGYGLTENALIGEVSYSNTEFLVPYTISLWANTTHDENKIEAGGSLSLSKTFAFSSPYHYLETSYNFNYTSSASSKVGQTLNIVYQKASYTGTGPFDIKGYGFSFKTFFNYSAGSVFFRWNLLPISYFKGLTLSIPTTTTFSLDSFNSVSFDMKNTLFAWEIHRGIDLLGIYIQRFVIANNFSISYSLLEKSISLENKLKAYIEFSLGIGSYIPSLSFKFGVNVDFTESGPAVSVGFTTF
ncbi:MAG: hypothetical protein HUK24_01080, partial [Sphaerochaetaceae bacterium]|nr:hypothetical protein [Sphaerochaetaceae bacterium]